MAITAGAALLGSAVVGAGSSLIGGSKSSKATRQAAASEAAAQEQNRALARETRTKNEQVLKPWIGIGQQVNPLIAGLLGYGNPAEGQTGLAAFRGATGYQDQLREGLSAVNNNAATSGLLNSGATLKALQERGNNLASGSFNNYLNFLIGQQGVGANAASALTGVNNNYSGQVTSANNAQGTTAANAALANAGIQNQMWGNIASGLGGALQGAFGGSGSLSSDNSAYQQLLRAGLA